MCGNTSNQKGGAYIFVLIVTLLLFLLISVTLAVTSYGRRVTAHYQNYTGLYDLAVAGNERALFLLRTELERQRDALDARVRAKIAGNGLMTHLVYRNRQFHLAYPEDGYYAKLYKEYAHEAMDTYVAGTFTYDAGRYCLEYTVTANFSENTNTETETDAENEGASAGEADITDQYAVATELIKQSGGYIVQTTVTKSIDGTESYPTVVEAEITWPEELHEEILIPSYSWKDKPSVYDTCLYTTGDVLTDDENVGTLSITHAPPLSTLTDASLLPRLSGYNEPALILTNETALDISTLYDGETPTPAAIIHNGSGPLRLYASDPALRQFTGIAICFNGVWLDGVDVTGTVMAGGDIRLSAPVTLSPEANALFSIPLSPLARQDFYDFLRLTNFTAAGDGAVTSFDTLLGRLTLAGGTGSTLEIAINNFDAVSPGMVKSKKIAD